MENTELKFTRERPNDGIHDRVEATSAATAIAELVAAGKPVEESDIGRYRAAKLGVESTSRDLDYCMKLELSEIMAEA